MIWVLISLIVSVLIGFTGAAIYAGELGGAGQASAETIFILMTVRLLPALMAGVVLSGILAATMSTADSQLLMVSSSIAQNLYKGIFKKNATEKQILDRFPSEHGSCSRCRCNYRSRSEQFHF